MIEQATIYGKQVFKMHWNRSILALTKVEKILMKPSSKK